MDATVESGAGMQAHMRRLCRPRLLHQGRWPPWCLQHPVDLKGGVGHVGSSAAVAQRLPLVAHGICPRMLPRSVAAHPSRGWDTRVRGRRASLPEPGILVYTINAADSNSDATTGRVHKALALLGARAAHMRACTSCNMRVCRGGIRVGRCAPPRRRGRDQPHGARSTILPRGFGRVRSRPTVNVL